MGFNSPNHTQVPNELFDLIPNMDKSELKVLLIIIRNTLGWHKNHVRLSIGVITKLTGLSRNSVIDGAEAAEKRGLIRRIPDRIPAEWEIVWNEHPQPLRDTPSTIEGVSEKSPQPLRGLKDNIKYNNKEIVYCATGQTDPTFDPNNLSLEEETNRRVNGQRAEVATQALRENGQPLPERRSGEAEKLSPRPPAAPPAASNSAAPQADHQSAGNSPQSPRQSHPPADAPARGRPKGSGSKADPRSSLPAIQAIRSVTGKYPRKEIYDELITVLGNNPDIARLQECWQEWLKRGYNPIGMGWVLPTKNGGGWYVTGITGNGYKNKSNQAAQLPDLSDDDKVDIEFLQFNKRGKLADEARARLEAKGIRV